MGSFLKQFGGFSQQIPLLLISQLFLILYILFIKNIIFLCRKLYKIIEEVAFHVDLDKLLLTIILDFCYKK